MDRSNSWIQIPSQPIVRRCTQGRTSLLQIDQQNQTRLGSESQRIWWPIQNDGKCQQLPESIERIRCPRSRCIPNCRPFRKERHLTSYKHILRTRPCCKYYNFISFVPSPLTQEKQFYSTRLFSQFFTHKK